MFTKLFLIAFIFEVTFSKELKTEVLLRGFTKGTIKTLNAKSNKIEKLSDDQCYQAWKTAYSSFLTALGTNNHQFVVFQNEQNTFPKKDSAEETRLEYDGPRSDQSIKAGQNGYRGVNRFVVYVTGVKANNNKVTITNGGKGIKIKRVFVSNDHYKNYHEVTAAGLTALGGKKTFNSMRTHYNEYDYNDEYDDDQDKPDHEEQEVYGYPTYPDGYLEPGIASMAYESIAIYAVVAIFMSLCFCIMAFGCGAVCASLFITTRASNQRVRLNKYNQLSPAPEQESVQNIK